MVTRSHAVAGRNVQKTIPQDRNFFMRHAIMRSCKHARRAPSAEAEGIATSKIAEQISYVREILRAFGVPQESPTFIGTDNTANQCVASGAAVPARSKHFLRRYHVLLECVRSREITIGHATQVLDQSH